MSQEPAQINDTLNKVSAAALKLLDTLLFRNPERTAIGIALGLAIAGFFNVCQPFVVSKGLMIGHLDWWAAVSVGLVLVHLTVYHLVGSS